MGGMMRLAAAAIVLSALALISPVGAAEKKESFDGPQIDPETWNLCQASPDLLSFGRDSDGKRSFLAIGIDGSRGDVDQCSSDTKERLGPSLIAPRRQLVTISDSNRCPQPEMQNGKALVQRNELRFTSNVLRHPSDRAHWYSLAFKMDGAGGDSIPDCGSVRWINAQWKLDKSSPGGSDSPFLAQRFDNGVLHITVQDGFCRCVIAKAEGDPDRTTYSAAQMFVEPGVLHAVPPLSCKVTREGPDEGRPCAPEHLRLQSPIPSAVPLLPDPKSDWVRLTYRLAVQGAGGARIDVFANGKLIVRASA